MHNSFIAVLLLLISQSVNSAAKIEHWQTVQGVRVFYVETKDLPMVDIRVVFDAGSARDGHQQGIAALTSALLDTAAGDWNADEIAQHFESTGAQYSSGVSRDMAWLSLRSLTEEKLLNKALQTMKVIISKPAFNETDFQREKNKTLAGLKYREESPGSIAKMAFFNALYKEHPYAHPTAGIVETVSGFSAADLKAFYKQHYVASNAMVIIVGDVKKQSAIEIAEFLLAGMVVGEKPGTLPKVQLPSRGVSKHIEFPSTQTHVLAGLIGMHRKDKDYFSLYVGNHILGGSGLVSLLFNEIREKRGLTYSAYSYFSLLFRNGPFIMGLQTRNDQTKQAIEVMQNTLEDFIDKGPGEKQLIAAKKNITGGFVLRFDTNSKLTSYVSIIGFYKLPLNYLDEFQQKVESVTIESIKDAFKRRVKPEFIHTITVGSASEK